MRQVAGTLRLDLAQYRELAAFAQFGSDLTSRRRRSSIADRRLVEILKQPQYQPLACGEAGGDRLRRHQGYLDPVPVEELRRYEEELYRYLETAGAARAGRDRGEEDYR
jgi:F-type H+-transporting ATPase subunit alpha